MQRHFILLGSHPTLAVAETHLNSQIEILINSCKTKPLFQNVTSIQKASSSIKNLHDTLSTFIGASTTVCLNDPLTISSNVLWVPY